jgi:hypothetical protein
LTVPKSGKRWSDEYIKIKIDQSKVNVFNEYWIIALKYTTAFSKGYGYWFNRALTLVLSTGIGFFGYVGFRRIGS